MWRDAEERAGVLASLKPDRPLKERVRAVVALRKRSQADLREELWGDSDVRSAVKAIIEPEEGQEEPPPAGILSAALGLLLNVTASSTNGTAVLHDTALRAAVLAATHKLQPELVQVNASLVMVNLVFIAMPVLSPDESREVYGVLAAAMAPGRIPRVRCAILGALWTLAAVPEVAEGLWKRPPIREEVLACVRTTSPEDVRASALGVLWAVSMGNQEQQQLLWANEDVRAAFVDGAHLDQPLGVRVNALSGLRSLAAPPANAVDMWAQEPLREAVLQGAAEDPLPSAREASLELLAQLATAKDNGLPMLDAGALEVFEAAMGDADLPSRLRRLCECRHAALLEAEEWREREEEEEDNEEDEEDESRDSEGQGGQGKEEPPAEEGVGQLGAQGSGGGGEQQQGPPQEGSLQPQETASGPPSPPPSAKRAAHPRA